MALAVEGLEPRRLMCLTHGDALEDVLADASARTAGAAATDHGPAWYAPARTAGHTASGDDAIAAAPTFAVNAAGLPLLTSRADGQGIKVFLDFDGYGTDTAFSTDGDLATFNASEQRDIHDTWRDIVSYFAPLNLNITTVQPPIGGSNPTFIWHRISNSIQGGAAYVGWFTNDSSNSWTGKDGGTTRHSGVAHEIGHQLGLSHQAEHDAAGVETTDYTDGYGNRDRSIIGVDYSENVRRWFYGRDSNERDGIQDDLLQMTTTVRNRIGGDGYRPDDFASTLASAFAVPASGMINGIIERLADVDVFRFTAATAGSYHIDATPTFESSVSPRIELLDAAGNIIAARDDADQRNTNNNDQEFSLNLAAGTYYVRLVGGGDYGEQGEYLLTAAPLTAGLPSGWTSQDVGATAIFRAGTAAFDPSSGTLTQLGGGSDIWGESDQFRFTSTTLTGDGSITARIDSLDETDFHAKAGVMIRGSTSTNAAHVFVGIKPSGQLDPIQRVANSATASAVGNPAGVAGPWVRLTRAGNLFTIDRSADGITWAAYGSTSVTMGSAVQIGFATNSRAPRAAAFATFSNIALTGALGQNAPTFNALPAPAGLTAAPAAGANTSINLSWAAVPDATGYAIDRSVDGVTFTQRSNVAAGVTTYADVNPFGSMRYFYRVSALGIGGTRSAPSANASTLNKPSAPINPVASYAHPVIRVAASGHVLLNWSDVQGDLGYRVERMVSPGGAWVTLAVTAQNYNAYNDTTVAGGTTYAYRVTPLTNVGDGLVASWTANVLTRPHAVSNFRIATRTPTSLSLAWTDLSVESAYRLERSTDATTWSLLAELPANATSYANSSGVAPLTGYYYRLRAVDSTGQAGDWANAFAATPSSVAPPAGWSSADIGSVPGAGASAGSLGSTWTVIGSGNDIWNTSDQFHYISRGVNGDGSITARLSTLDVTDYFVKAGLMFRASTAANAPYAFMHYSDGPGLQFEFRDANGAGSGNNFVLDSAARWMRLTRTGNVFTGSYSEDGVNWTVAASRSITMPTLAAVGLAASSHNMTRLTRATFDNLSTTGATPNAAPVIVTAASATPTPVTGTSTTLSVTASDDGPASELTYGWVTVSKPHAAVADPTFSINNTNGARVTTATFAAAGNYLMRVTVRDAQGLAVTSEVAVVVTLRAGTGTYEFDAPRPQLVVTFNGNIAASLGASDLALTNLTTGETVPAAEMASSFDAATGRATFTFTGRPDGTLPDGNYRATIAAGSVAEPSLVSLAADAAFDFFVKAGDANRDRVVDFQDLVILADAYNQAGRTFSGGNFNYDPDGRVDFADLVILAQNYNTTLAATPAAASAPLPMASATSLTTTTKRRKGSAAATDIV